MFRKNTTKRNTGMIAYIDVAWNGAPVTTITPNKIMNEIKKLINS